MVLEEEGVLDWFVECHDDDMLPGGGRVFNVRTLLNRYHINFPKIINSQPTLNTHTYICPDLLSLYALSILFIQSKINELEDIN